MDLCYDILFDYSKYSIFMPMSLSCVYVLTIFDRVVNPHMRSSSFKHVRIIMMENSVI